MNGVMMPSVSAGSSHREASVMCTPQVMVPSGAAPAGRPAPSARTATRSAGTVRDVRSLMCLPCKNGLGTTSDSRAVRPALGRQSWHQASLDATLLSATRPPGDGVDDRAVEWWLARAASGDEENRCLACPGL